MRLICPNCGAQYEVSADVIPAAGRDVQCSNCGHTWFETPGASEAAEAEAASPDTADEAPGADAAPEADAAAPDPQPTEDVQPKAQDRPAPPMMPAPDVPAAPAPAPVAAPEPTLSAAPRRAAPDAAAAPRPPLDSSIADMLREEAAREEAMRAAEAGTGLERQADLGLDDMPTMTPQKRAEAAEKVSQLTGAAEGGTAAAIAATVAASRKELLPDIEEINSTLRSDAERDTASDAPEEVANKRGFRFGFVAVMTCLIILTALYLAAGPIAARVPALEEILTAYVSAVDALRLWLDGQVEKLLVMVEPSEANN